MVADLAQEIGLAGELAHKRFLRAIALQMLLLSFALFASLTQASHSHFATLCRHGSARRRPAVQGSTGFALNDR